VASLLSAPIISNLKRCRYIQCNGYRNWWLYQALAAERGRLNTVPSCNITGNNTICVGNSASFTATGGGSYAWSGPGAFTAGNLACDQQP
jgi:hypothetical protein